MYCLTHSIVERFSSCNKGSDCGVSPRFHCAHVFSLSLSSRLEHHLFAARTKCVASKPTIIYVHIAFYRFFSQVCEQEDHSDSLSQSHLEVATCNSLGWIRSRRSSDHALCSTFLGYRVFSEGSASCIHPVVVIGTG